MKELKIEISGRYFKIFKNKLQKYEKKRNGVLLEVRVKN